MLDMSSTNTGPGYVPGNLRVAVVDDSMFVRQNLSAVLRGLREITRVTSVKHPLALEKENAARALDLVLIDFHLVPRRRSAFMAFKAGLGAPVVVMVDEGQFSTEIYLECVNNGVTGIFLKPAGADFADFEETKDHLRKLVTGAAKDEGFVFAQESPLDPEKIINVPARRNHTTTRNAKIQEKPRSECAGTPSLLDPAIGPSSFRRDTTRPLAGRSFDSEQDILVVIGASTGGPRLLRTIISQLRGGLSASFVLVQHMPREFTRALARRLDACSPYPVQEAFEGLEFQAGHVYLAPGHFNLLLAKVRNHLAFKLDRTMKAHHVRPSIDVFIHSALPLVKNAVGVLLSGMGNDGAMGLVEIKARGGSTIVQDEATSQVWSMPKKAIDLGAADQVLPIQEIPARLHDLLVKGVTHK